ncbi:MAG: FMN-binding protein [Spirochaetales bacterium]|nr:FMN-binding protein [Spirochaetales bacterium]
MVLFLLALFTICTLVLTGAQLAYDKASAIFNLRLYAEIMDLYSIEYQEDEIEETFSTNFTVMVLGDSTYYISDSEPDNEHPGSIVFKTAGPGLWSIIEILLAVDSEMESLIGMRVLSQAETPGLGGRISEPDFQESFSGADIRPNLSIVKFATLSNEVDAISGATKTSTSLETIINKAILGLDMAFQDQGSNE